MELQDRNGGENRGTAGPERGFFHRKSWNGRTGTVEKIVERKDRNGQFFVFLRLKDGPFSLKKHEFL